MSYKYVARFLAITFAATLIGMSFTTIASAKSSLPENTIAAKEKPICDRHNVCLPPPD